MSKHIGIVACSAEGAALCYRTICQEGAALLGEAHAHPEISMHTPSLADYMSCLEKGDLEGVASLMLDSSHKLQATGADFLRSTTSAPVKRAPSTRWRAPSSTP